MFITKKHIPRRTFLQGAGATIALPLLELSDLAQKEVEHQVWPQPGDLVNDLAAVRP